MAQCPDAVEIQQRCEKLRAAVVADILKYNEEDLAATWAVFCWLRELGRGDSCYPVWAASPCHSAIPLHVCDGPAERLEGNAVFRTDMISVQRHAQ